MTHPTGIVEPHPTLTTSPTDITHATIPWTKASLAPATPTALLLCKAVVSLLLLILNLV